MVTHQNWSTDAFELPTVSPGVGPFPQRRWLETWWKHRGQGELLLAEAADSLLPLTLHQGRLEFAGEADLTDYHSPLGSSAVLPDLLSELPKGTILQLDSLPADSAASISDALDHAGVLATTEQHNVAAVLTLPPTFDEYLAGIRKKERHELRRKRRRFEAEAGPGRVERRSGVSAVALFADLHRRSSGDKGSFMTSEMEQFFFAMHRDAGGVIDVLVDGSDRPVSAIYSFEDDRGFYLYNSAFEPEARNLSPGNVMLSHLIERTIGQGKTVFDFLKGDETYKFRLGAEPRPLYVVTATVGAPR